MINLLYILWSHSRCAIRHVRVISVLELLESAIFLVGMMLVHLAQFE